MKNKNIIYLAGIVVTGALTITGCGGTEVKEEIPIETEAKDTPVPTESGPYFEYFIEDPGSTIKKPYEHLLFKKYSAIDSDNGVDYHPEAPVHIDQASIDVPEGYMPVGPGPLSHTSTRDNPTNEEQFWFVNYVPVEVQPVYHKYNMYYDYSDFGTPVKYTKEDISDYSMPLESEDQVVTLK